MARWTVDEPMALDFDDVRSLNVRLSAGTVAVLASDDKRSTPGETAPRTLPGAGESVPGRAAVVVSELSGRPILVSHEDGVLTVAYESLTWEGLLGFLKPLKDSAAVTITVPADCPARFGVLRASAVVSGLTAGASVRNMSGEVTLDGVTGDVDAETMSGELAACDVEGALRIRSMSGGVTVAGGLIDSLEVSTMSGQVTGDFALRGTGNVQVSTMSGDVTLRLPAESDARVHMQSTSGAVRTEFATLRTIRAPGSRAVSGNVGAGAGHVSVTTMSGAITLLRRSPVGMESKTR